MDIEVGRYYNKNDVTDYGYLDIVKVIDITNPLGGVGPDRVYYFRFGTERINSSWINNGFEEITEKHVRKIAAGQGKNLTPLDVAKIRKQIY